MVLNWDDSLGLSFNSVRVLRKMKQATEASKKARREWCDGIKQSLVKPLASTGCPRVHRSTIPAIPEAETLEPPIPAMPAEAAVHTIDSEGRVHADARKSFSVRRPKASTTKRTKISSGSSQSVQLPKRGALDEDHSMSSSDSDGEDGPRRGWCQDCGRVVQSSEVRHCAIAWCKARVCPNCQYKPDPDRSMICSCLLYTSPSPRDRG